MHLSNNDIKKIALKTLDIETDAIKKLSKAINDDFVNVIQQIHASKGRVVITGIGKSVIIANKIVATLNSTGTPAILLHAADAIHGDLGMVQEEDIVIAISKSGESPEIKVLAPFIKNAGNKLIAISTNADSTLAKMSDIALISEIPEEACPNNLAPTASTTAQLVLGDAIAVCLLELKGFSPQDFAKFHPGGALGKQLYLKVEDLSANNKIPFVEETVTIDQVIVEITSNRLGATAVVDKNKNLKGIITDGDIRRMLNNKTYKEDLQAKSIMGKNPKTIQKGTLAIDALEQMRQNSISQIIVLEQDRYIGIVHIHDIIKEGLF